MRNDEEIHIALQKKSTRIPTKTASKPSRQIQRKGKINEKMESWEGKEENKNRWNEAKNKLKKVGKKETKKRMSSSKNCTFEKVTKKKYGKKVKTKTKQPE